MNPEERAKKEGELEILRTAADEAHQKAAETPGDQGLQKKADEAEEKYNDLKTVLDADTPAPELSEEEDDEEEEKDIDFEKELKELENPDDPAPRADDDQPPPVGRTPQEKAERALYFAAQQVKKLGGDPTKIVKPKGVRQPDPVPPKDENADLDPRYVTVDHVARQEAEALSSSPAQAKVVLWHYKHSIKETGDIKKDIETAFIIANKGRITRSFDEIRRAKRSVPVQVTPPGRRPAARSRTPQLSSSEQASLKRRGFSPQADGSWAAKRYVVRHVEGKGWITERKQNA